MVIGGEMRGKDPSFSSFLFCIHTFLVHIYLDVFPGRLDHVCTITISILAKVPMREDEWGDSDRVAFSLAGCDSVALAADGGLSFVCPTAIIIIKY